MRLLIVATYKTLKRALRRGLEEEGFKVDAVHDLNEGNQRAASINYDAIIMDLLPRESCLSLLRDWRQNGLHTPILALTACNRWEENLYDEPLRAVYLLTKPFQFNQIITGLHTLRQCVPHSAECGFAD